MFYTETPYQHYLDNSPACPAPATTSSATAPANADAFVYDADCNVLTETVARVVGFATTPTPEKTSKWYDGEDHLVEVQQPQDPNNDTYTNPWLTRYIYDIGNDTSVSFNAMSNFLAYGNLYKTQELLPSGNSPVTETATTPQSIANTVFQDLKGTAFDALDRPVANYALISQNGAETLSSETMTYDGSNQYGTFTGLLTADCNAMSQCKYPGYDALDRTNAIAFSDSSPLRTSLYDPDGRTVAIASSVYGTQSFTYDNDGHKLTEKEASAGGVTSPATFTHEYYADGMLKQLDVASTGLNQNGLFAYSYRPDGLMQTQTVNDAAQSNVGTATVVLTYSARGRVTQRTESGTSGNPNPMTWTYDAFGRTATMDVPACGACGQLLTHLAIDSYDPQGQLLQSCQSIPSVGTCLYKNYGYSTRGELVVSPLAPGPLSLGQPTQNFMANSVQNAQFISSSQDSASTTWDSRSGAILSRNTSVPLWVDGALEATTSQATFTYDQSGRLTADATVSSSPSNTVSDTLSRTYDAENHTTTSTDGNTSTTGLTSKLGSITAYDWGPMGHAVRVGSATGTTSTIPSIATVQYDSLHWDGDQLVFQTNASGQVNDIKIGTNGDITPLDAAFTGLTFWDRAPDNTILSSHTSIGTCGAYVQSNGSTFTVPCPTSFLLQSGEFVSGPGSKFRSPSYQVGIGQGALLGMARTDAMTDGFNALQGARTMDVNAGTWTTPDAFPGYQDDPSSQKAFVWNENNPVQFSDPTGNNVICKTTEVVNTNTNAVVSEATKCWDDGLDAGEPFGWFAGLWWGTTTYQSVSNIGGIPLHWAKPLPQACANAYAGIRANIKAAVEVFGGELNQTASDLGGALDRKQEGYDPVKTGAVTSNRASDKNGLATLRGMNVAVSGLAALGTFSDIAHQIVGIVGPQPKANDQYNADLQAAGCPTTP